MSESHGSCTSVPEGHEPLETSRLTVADLELSDLLQQAVIQNQLSAQSVAPAYLLQLGSPTRHSIRLPVCTIGRNASNQIVVSGDPSVSRHHCLVLPKGDSYYIVDLGSKNGTIVNDEPIAAQCRLIHGDRLRIGVTRFEFCLVALPDENCTKGQSARSQPGADILAPASPSLTNNHPAGEEDELIEYDTLQLLDRPRRPESARLSSPAGEQLDAAYDDSGAAADAGLLASELAQLHSRLASLERQAQELRSLIYHAQGMKNSLLLADGDEFTEACAQVFEMMGWAVDVSESDHRELILMHPNTNEVGIVTRIHSQGNENLEGCVAELINSKIALWASLHYEPAAVLVVSFGHPRQCAPLNGTQDTDVIKYARKHNVCLMTSTQLLSIYGELVVQSGDPSLFRKLLLESHGLLSWARHDVKRPGTV